MKGLSNEQIQEIKQRLSQDLNNVKKRIEELKAQDPFGDPDRLNDNAASDLEANEESGHDRVQALLTELSSQGAAIESALDRISKGTYGVCSICGNPIELERLKAVPTATKCISCQSKENK